MLGDSLRHEGGIWLRAAWATTLLSLVYIVMLEITEANERVSVSRRERMILVWWIMAQCQSSMDCGNIIVRQHCTKSVKNLHNAGHYVSMWKKNSLLL